MHFHNFVYICICIYSWRILLNKFFGKQLRRCLFFNKAADVKPGILFKKRPRHSCFPVNFEKSLEIHHWRHLVVVSHNYSFIPQNFEILILKSASLFLRDLLSKIILLLFLKPEYIPRHQGQRSFFFKKGVLSINKFENTQFYILRCFDYQNYLIILVIVCSIL